MKTDQILHTCFPYLIRRMADGTYTAFGREYNVIGSRLKFRVTEKLRAEITAFREKPDADQNSFYLYDDGCSPWANAINLRCYFARLQALVGTHKGWKQLWDIAEAPKTRTLAIPKDPVCRPEGEAR